MIYRMIYVSTPVAAPMNEMIQQIASVALERNSAHGITGYLYYHRDLFLQELEGMREDVEAIFNNIRRDTRHRNICQLMGGHASSRVFGEWSMAFHDGGRDGGLIKRYIGDASPDQLGEEAGPELLRFLRDLSLRRAGLMPETPDMTQIGRSAT